MSDNLLSVSIQRRCVAVAVFSGMRLEWMQTRELSHDGLTAGTTVHRLISKTLRAFPVESAVLEDGRFRSDTRRADLARLARTALAESGVPVTSATTAELLAAFGVPALRTRKRLREIVAHCWPALLPRFGTPTVLDAAALGLFAQVRGYFDK